MELDEALHQITVIRRQLDRAEVYRGIRALPVAASGALAFVAAWYQSVWIENPREDLESYLALWMGSAVLSACGAGFVMARRAARVPSAWGRRLTWQALEHLVPALVAGAMLTVVLMRSNPASAGLLPGLWQLFFSMGIFAASRMLPRMIFWVGVFYLVTGLGCLAWFPGDSSLAPWVMGLPFGMGQLMASAILYWTLERSHDHPEFEG